jgi:hypothetical protein
MKSFGYYSVQCFDKSGLLKWTDLCQNQLYNEGQYALLDIGLRGGSAPTQWAIGLFDNSLVALPDKDSTLASLDSAGPYEFNNVDDPGYSARQQINRDGTASGWPTLELSGDDEQATSKTVTFTATADWTHIVNWMFLTTVVSIPDTTGLLISIAELSAERTVLNGDSLNITYNLKLV